MRQLVKRLGLVFFLFQSGVVSAYQVLAIHSYHPDFFWTKSLVDGIEEKLQGQNITVEHTYMDTKRVQSPDYHEQLKQLYLVRLRSQQYDAILTTDNAALWLVNELGAVVGTRPVIFSGLNVESVAEFGNIPRLSGVEESANIAANLDLIKKLHPDVNRVWLALDDAFSSRQYWKAIKSSLHHAKTIGLDIQRLHQMTFGELVNQVGAMGNQDAVLFISFFKDADGAFMEHSDLLRQLTAANQVPVYGVNSFMLPYGVIGGMMVDGNRHGEMQAELLMAALEGEVMPPVVRYADTPMFSHQEVKRRTLSTAEIEGATFPDRPLPFWQRNLDALYSSFAIMLIACVIIGFLTKQMNRQKQGEQALAQSRALFKGVFEQSHQYIALLDYRGRVVSTNGAFRRLFPNYASCSFLPLWKWSEWLGAERLRLQLSSLIEGQTSRFEVCLISEQHNEVILDVAIKALPDHSHADAQILFEGRDISQRKMAEQKLQRSEVEYRMLYEQQPVMLLTIDQQSRIQSANQCATEWLGYSKRDLLGHKVTDFYVDDSPPPRSLLNGKQVEQFGIRRREICYRTQDGQKRWIRESIRSTQVQSQLLLVGEDITENRRMEEQLRYQARHDFLTGLYNRNYFEGCLIEALNAHAETSEVHAMFYIDLDQFRVINDTVGHEAGDEALKQIAQELKQILPSDATLARLGGDEFAVICYHCDENKALELGRTLMAALSELDFYWKNSRLALGCSVGIRMLDCTAGSPQQVHAQADTACYAAKHDGRSRVHLYRPDDQELLRHEQEMSFVNKIHEALAEDRFEVFAQQISPTMPTANKKLYFEVLVRMRDEFGENVPPGQFIPAAERYNMAHLIDKRVIEKTLDWFEAHPEYLDAVDTISINLSGRSMSDDAFIAFLIGKLTTSTVPTNMICLEITETAAIGNLTDAIELFTKLKQLGCTIALDDFGSGLSSFGYLKRLPVDVIKIDGQFVRDIADDEADYVMVRAIHELASHMGKKTVAEFVENESILKRLQSLGVDYAQGYYFSMPKPMEQLVQEYAKQSATVMG